MWRHLLRLLLPKDLGYWAITIITGCIVAGLVVVMNLLFPKPACAADVPRAAIKYRADLVRIVHELGGLDAPVALFAAQIHQESGWNPAAVSGVGAQGMGQFMPATASWWCRLIGAEAHDCNPSNPVWSMRALVGYDLWLFDRVAGVSAFDQWWAALRGYNGGLGHWQKEAALVAPALDRAAVDAACGKARRKPQYCPENLGYPRRIMLVLQPLYLGWGPGVSS